MSILALLACEHQYIAIPDAEVLSGTPQYYYTNQWVGQTPPTYVVTAGSTTLAPGESFTMEVDFSAEVEFEVTELVFLGLETGDTDFGDHWIYVLDDEEKAAKKAEITVHALSEKPTKEWCTPKRLGTWTCYQVADEGVNGLGMSSAGDDSISTYTQLPIVLAPIREPSGSGDVCAGYGIEDCCTDPAGVDVLQCAWDPACGSCPDGTTDAGTDASGYLLCDCPG